MSCESSYFAELLEWTSGVWMAGRIPSGYLDRLVPCVSGEEGSIGGEMIITVLFLLCMCACLLVSIEALRNALKTWSEIKK